MTDVTSIVEQYLVDENMRYNRLADHDFRLIFGGQSMDTIAIYIHCSDNFVSLSTPLTVPIEKGRLDVYEQLLRWCLMMNFAKVGLDSYGTPILQIEWPSSSLNRSEFLMAIGALAYYADEYYPQLISLVVGEGNSQPLSVRAGDA